MIRRTDAPRKHRDRAAARGDGVGVSDAEQTAVEQLSRRLWHAELRLAEARRAATESERRLEAVFRSASWRITAPLRLFPVSEARLARLVRGGAKLAWWTLTLQLPRRLGERRDAIAGTQRAAKRPPEVYADWVREFDTLDDSDLEGMAALYESLERRPLVSVVMPVFDPPEHVLREAIESVRTQAYADWELCIADDASTEPHVGRVLHEYELLDDRIRVVRRATTGGISAASNSALELARGELVALLDHDDLLRPHSLLLSVLPFERDPRVGFTYSDADRIDEHGRRISHYFKPDWSPLLLLGQNYLCHLSVIRTALVRAVGGFRSAYDGSQDWDLNLRVTELLPPEAIVHVPHVLYHWRAIPGSVAAQGVVDAKPYAVEAARRAVEDHLARTGRHGYVLPVGDHQKVRFFVGSPRPRVSVVVPSTGRKDLLEPCIEGLLSKTAYDRLEVVVAVEETAHDDPATRRFLTELSSRPSVRLHSYPARAFNFALTINEAVAKTDTPLVLLLNDDTEVVDEGWLDAMVGYAQEENVGAVGGMLVYPDGTIHSAGMLVGARRIAENRYHRRPADVTGYASRARLPQDLSAVVGTCMLVRREAFLEVGGLDVCFPVAYNDVDFCLKLRRAGWRVLYAPDALLVHRGSASFEGHHRGREEEHQRDTAVMEERWGRMLLDDPTHNPNLELNASDPSQPAWPPRVAYPWRGRTWSDRRQAGPAQVRANRVGASSSSSAPA